MRKTVICLVATLEAFCGLLTAAPRASSEKVLDVFNGLKGASSNSSLIFDAAGNLYGTTVGGGISNCSGSGCGVAFKLSPSTGGKWSETVLHKFHGKDGANPYANLTFDAAGNLFGTTSGGGAHGHGVVFKLTPRANGQWTETVLHSFNGVDGSGPAAGLVWDAAGNLYGTTTVGGSGCSGSGCGTVFELSPGQNGNWREKVLHSFNGTDGYVPRDRLVWDTSGNLYSTTEFGGVFKLRCPGSGCGTVFKLSPGTNGQWTETVLHSFGHSTDGAVAYSGVIIDAEGNLYGTTVYGGNYRSCGSGCGVVFELTPGQSGQWAETILHIFTGEDGANPNAGLVLNANGNLLYGTTSNGGTEAEGTVFQLAPGSNGKWTERVLHSFRKSFPDGREPVGGLVSDSAGNLYGTTPVGGYLSLCNGVGCGVVYQVTP
jgi:uncharacterized repeat protein (TIGR03803 family)